ncbi:MAG TPA: DUF2381 family protein [Archangium sp.]|nr:DUF2381 family protein [Archangium sp.]
MFVLSSALLMGVSLWASPTAAEPSSVPHCETGTRHLELSAERPGGPPEVCIHPGLSTTFVFDARLARMELAQPERFRVADLGTESLTLVPTVALGDGERVPLTVFFRDGVAPVSATFSLVVHPSDAERQVEVTRPPRSGAACQEGERRAREEARQCREEKAHLEAEHAGRTGLLGLIAQELLREGGITDKDITRSVISRPGNTLTSISARSYRSATGREEGGRRVVRMAVQQQVRNTGTRPWTPAGAVLMGPPNTEWRALGVGPLVPIAPGAMRSVGAEVEVPEEAARGTFTLKLWSQDGGPGEFFDGVTFP